MLAPGPDESISTPEVFRRPSALSDADGVTDIDADIAAWADCIATIAELGETLTDEEWAAPTECPGWTVKDVYAHLIGGEEWMSTGHPPLTSFREAADEPVYARRDTPPGAVLAELRTVLANRRSQLAARPPVPGTPALTAHGLPVNVGVLYQLRAFDAWIHEQDIRRAIGRPGNLDSAAAATSRDVLLVSLPRIVAKLARVPAGSTVRLTVDGATGFDLAVRVDDAGRGHVADVPDGPATSQLRTDWETFARLSAGRIDPGTAPVRITGDVGMAHRVLNHLAVTP